MPQMDHLGTRGLNDPTHDINGGIMPIEERCSGYDPNFVLGDVWRGLDVGGHAAKILSRSAEWRMENEKCKSLNTGEI